MRIFRSRILILALLVTVPLALSGCGGGDQGMADLAQQGLNSLLGVVGNAPQLSTLLGLVQSAGLENLLSGDNPVTLLAPSNDAFQALGADVLSNLTKPENADQLKDILSNHVVEGGLSAAQLAGAGSETSMLGNALDVSGTTDALMVGGANVTKSMEGSNGFVHVIDKVLVP